MNTRTIQVDYIFPRARRSSRIRVEWVALQATAGSRRATARDSEPSRARNTMNMCTVCAAGPAAERRARSARARRAVAQAAHDGEVRKRFSNLTIVCGLAVGRAECVSFVYLCHVSSCPAGRGLPAACGTRSSESDKQPHASLLSQRPSHPTDRPDPGRPRPALLPLQAVVRARNGCCSLPRGCSAPRCWSCG